MTRAGATEEALISTQLNIMDITQLSFILYAQVISSFLAIDAEKGSAGRYAGQLIVSEWKGESRCKEVVPAGAIHRSFKTKKNRSGSLLSRREAKDGRKNGTPSTWKYMLRCGERCVAYSLIYSHRKTVGYRGRSHMTSRTERGGWANHEQNRSILVSFKRLCKSFCFWENKELKALPIFPVKFREQKVD